MSSVTPDTVRLKRVEVLADLFLLATQVGCIKDAKAKPAGGQVPTFTFSVFSRPTRVGDGDRVP